MLQLLLLFSCKHELLRLQFLNTILISAFILHGLNNRSGLQQFLFQMFQLLPILRIPLSGLLLKVEEGDQLLRCHVYIISWDLVMSYLLTAAVVLLLLFSLSEEIYASELFREPKLLTLCSDMTIRCISCILLPLLCVLICPF